MWKERLKEIWDCIRFPFLYPRNRFTGLHYNNWKILDWIQEKSKESSIFVHLTLKDTEIFGPKIYWLDTERYLIAEIRDKQIWIILTGPNKFFEKVVLKLDVPGEILDYSWGSDGLMYVRLKKLPDGHMFISDKIIHKHWTWMMTRIVRWFHNGPLQLFHCIPDHTELWALDKGWKIAFGENLCKDLRKALWKEGGLKSILNFRITQIKEKYGYLHLYYTHGGNEVEKVVSKYEDISENTCIVCGKPATWRTTGWICPYCDDCIKGNNPYGDAERIEKREGL